MILHLKFKDLLKSIAKGCWKHHFTLVKNCVLSLNSMRPFENVTSIVLIILNPTVIFSFSCFTEIQKTSVQCYSTIPLHNDEQIIRIIQLKKKKAKSIHTLNRSLEFSLRPTVSFKYLTISWTSISMMTSVLKASDTWFFDGQVSSFLCWEGATQPKCCDFHNASAPNIKV